MVALINRRTGIALASRTEFATTASERRRGLLGRDTFDRSSALVLSPCRAIHTAFMRFPLDVLFVDRQGRVVRIVRTLKPWRTAMALTAHAVIEFPARGLQGQDLNVGDHVDCRVLPAPPVDVSPLSRLT